MQKEEKQTCFCTFQDRSSCVNTRRTNVRHFGSGRHLEQFLRIFWRTKVDPSKQIIPRLLTHHGVSLSKI